jgi:hypothetical protein
LCPHKPWLRGFEVKGMVVGLFKTGMRLTLIIWTLIILTGCNLKEKKNIQPVNGSSYSNIDTTSSKAGQIEETSETDPYDGLANAFFDTTTLKGKRQWIMNHFIARNKITSPDYDTLIDLTYDGHKDYVIGYYRQSGTGIKNRVNVYFYKTQCKCYILNEQLSNLPNPTFYIKQKRITGFYIGNGGGGGGRLEWLNGKWTTTKEFDVDNEGDTTKWKISYPLKKRNKIIIRPYQMIPPNDILETNIKL